MSKAHDSAHKSTLATTPLPAPAPDAANKPSAPAPDNAASEPDKAVNPPAPIGGDPAGPDTLAPKAEAPAPPTAPSPYNGLPTTTVETMPAPSVTEDPQGSYAPAPTPAPVELPGKFEHAVGDEVVITLGSVQLEGKVSGASTSASAGQRYDVDVHHEDSKPMLGTPARLITLPVPADVVSKPKTGE